MLKLALKVKRTKGGEGVSELGERKKLILATVVEQYIKTGEPIGSKELLALTGMSV